MSETQISVVYQKLLFYASLLFILAIHIRGHHDECPLWLGDHLPDKIVPIHYNISLKVNSSTNIISGVTGILIQINETATKNIIFHGYKLRIDWGKIVLKANTSNLLYTPYKISYCEKKETIVIEFTADLTYGLYELIIPYDADIYEDKGLVKSYYIDEDGHKRSSYVTMFELTGARRLFPCWDDPKIRATFNISVLHLSRYTVLSNMRIHTHYNVGHLLTKSNFHVTPAIPTFFVMIAQIDLAHVSEHESIVYVWCRLQLTSQVKFAQTMAQRTVRFLNWYLNRSNQTLQIDLIALPQFSGQAIGSSTFTVFREEHFVYDQNLHFSDGKVEVATAVIQGVANQWLDGFKISTHWTEVCFKKALAIYVGRYAHDQLDIDWWTMDLFVVQILQPAFRNDNEMNIIPVVHKFDPIYSRFTYNKGSIIIRMLEHTVTNMVFRSSILEYLSDIAPKKASYRNFTRVLQKKLVQLKGENYTSYNLETAMLRWISQRLYPVLTVKRHYDSRETVISQDILDYKRNISWYIPVTYTTKSELDFNQTTPRRWLISSNVSIDDIDPNDWIIVNIQQTGYYRVNYDSKNWYQIEQYLKSPDYKNIHVLNRAQLIDDAYYFLMNNKIVLSTFLDITKYLKKETDYIPWYPMFNILWYISHYFDFPESRFIKEHLLYILDGLLKNIGYDDDPVDDNMRRALRLLATRWACRLGQTECIEKAHAKLLKHLENPMKNPILPAWKEWTNCEGLKMANITVWKQFMNLIESKNDINSLKYLYCAEDNAVISHYLYSLTAGTGYFGSLAEDTRIKLFILMLKKHVRKDEILTNILFRFNSIKFRDFNNRKKLIHIVMGLYSKTNFKKITEIVNKTFTNDQETVKEVERAVELRSSQVERCKIFYAYRL